jgi:hypothetical protein
MFEARREGQRGEARTHTGARLDPCGRSRVWSLAEQGRLTRSGERLATSGGHVMRDVGDPQHGLSVFGGHESPRRGSTVGWPIGMTGIMLTGVVFQWKPRQAGHIASWQQPRAVEQRKGEAASRLSDTLERHQAMDHAKGSMEGIDGELSRLPGAQGQSVTTPQQPSEPTSRRHVLGALEKVDGKRCVMLHDTERR